MKTPFTAKDTRTNFINTFFLKNLAKTPSRTSLCSLSKRNLLICNKRKTARKAISNRQDIIATTNLVDKYTTVGRMSARIGKAKNLRNTRSRLRQTKLDRFARKNSESGNNEKGCLQEEKRISTEEVQKTEQENQMDLTNTLDKRKETTMTTLSGCQDISLRPFESKFTAPSINKTGVFKNKKVFEAFNLKEKNGTDKNKFGVRRESLSNHNKLLSFFNQNGVKTGNKEEEKKRKNCSFNPYDHLYEKMLPKTQDKAISQRQLDDPQLAVYYKLESFLGKGSFAEVRLATRKSDNTLVAVKTYCNDSMKSTNRKKIIANEIKILKKVNHFNIVKLLDVVISRDYTHLVLEYIEGTNLYECFWQKKKGFDEQTTKNIITQLTDALLYLHSLNIYHRDIKLDNVIINKNGKVTLIDFGFSIYVENDDKIKSFCGTPNYMSPELYKRIRYRGSDVDTWALTVLLFKLSTGSFPFRKSGKDKSPKKAITEVDFTIPEEVSRELRAVFIGVFKIKAEERIRLEKINNLPRYK